ncbi:hypothetical protein BH23GEM10_BH23GEM10_09320 [soil metagenome]
MTMRTACLTLLMLLLPVAAHAQRVEIRGRGDVANDTYLRQLVERGSYTLVAEDTLLARTDTLRGPVLVLGSTVRVEGVIDGDLIIVDSNVFLRPTGRVTGSVRNIGGGWFPSELAVIGGATTSLPNADYIVERGDGVIVILGTVARSNLVREGLGGVRIPTYDRVSGLSLSIGVGYLLPRVGRVEPVVRGRVGYRSQRGRFDGGVELAGARGGTELGIGVERTTLTNEQWIRSDLNNTISSFLQGKDRRDYYEVERAYAELRRLLESGPRETSAYLRAQVEDARPLAPGQPWSVLGTFRGDNMQFAPGRISSLTAGALTSWSAQKHVVEVGGLVEVGADVLDADHSFARYAVDTDWAMSALRDHTLRIRTHFQGPLPGTTTLPDQRWSFVGGSGTLNTFEEAEFRGDRVAMVETDYSIPLPAFMTVRMLGRPSLDLLHMAGMAWAADEARDFEQNIGLRLGYNILYARVITHPDRLSEDLEFTVGIRFPRRAYAWQQSFDTRPENR